MYTYRFTNANAPVNTPIPLMEAEVDSWYIDENGSVGVVKNDDNGKCFLYFDETDFGSDTNPALELFPTTVKGITIELE